MKACDACFLRKTWFLKVFQLVFDVVWCLWYLFIQQQHCYTPTAGTPPIIPTADNRHIIPTTPRLHRDYTRSQNEVRPDYTATTHEVRTKSGPTTPRLHTKAERSQPPRLHSDDTFSPDDTATRHEVSPRLHSDYTFCPDYTPTTLPTTPRRHTKSERSQARLHRDYTRSQNEVRPDYTATTYEVKLKSERSQPEVRKWPIPSILYLPSSASLMQRIATGTRLLFQAWTYIHQGFVPGVHKKKVKNLSVFKHILHAFQKKTFKKWGFVCRDMCAYK